MVPILQEIHKLCVEERLKHVQLLRNLRIKELLGNCLESKKLLEKKKVDRNTRSCQKVAEQLAESPSQVRE